MFIAYKLPLEGRDAIRDVEMVKMQMSNLLSEYIQMIDIGTDECDTVWLLIVVSAKQFSTGKTHTYLRTGEKVSRFLRQTTYPSSFFERLAAKVKLELFGAIFDVDRIITRPNSIEQIGEDYLSLRNVQNLSNQRDGVGIVLGNGRCSFVVVEGSGLCPATCGTHLNKQRARAYHDIQVRASELGGTLNNSSYEELPSDYRNPYKIVDGMDNVRIIKHITTIVSVKGGM